MTISIDIGNDGVFVMRAVRIALAEARFAGFAIIDAQIIFIGIDNFSFAVAIEIENRRPCTSRGLIMGATRPNRFSFVIERNIAKSAGK